MYYVKEFQIYTKVTISQGVVNFLTAHLIIRKTIHLGSEDVILVRQATNKNASGQHWIPGLIRLICIVISGIIQSTLIYL